MLCVFSLLVLSCLPPSTSPQPPVVVWPNPLIKYDTAMLSAPEISFLLSHAPPMSASPHTNLIYTGEDKDVQTSDPGPHRTSTASGFYVQQEDLLPTLRSVITKLSDFGGHPPSHGEPLQVKRGEERKETRVGRLGAKDEKCTNVITPPRLRSSATRPTASTTATTTLRGTTTSTALTLPPS